MLNTHILRSAGAVAFAALALILGACTNPTTSTPTQTKAVAHTISGVVKDLYTGAGVSGASVVLGKYSATTDSSGNYKLTLDSGVTSVTGDLAVTDGTDYDFVFMQNATVDASSNPTNIDVSLTPTWPQTAVTVSGTVYDSTGKTALTNVSSVALTVLNTNGGNSSGYSTYTTTTSGGTYSIALDTRGSNCFVAAAVTYSDTTPKSFFYLKDVDLSSTTASLNLDVPAASSSDTSVTLQGLSSNATAEYGLVVPGYGTILAGSSGTTAIQVYDPDGYSIVLAQQLSASVSSPAGENTMQFAEAAPAALSSTMTLPALSVAAPSTPDDMSSATYSSGTITYAPNTNANDHLMALVATVTNSSTQQSTGFGGYLWLTSSSTNVTLPSQIQSVLSSVKTAWAGEAMAANSTGISSVDGGTLLSMMTSGQNSLAGFSVGFQVALLQDTTTGENTALIPAS